MMCGFHKIGLRVAGVAVVLPYHGLIIERTIAARIPAIFQWPDYAEGGLDATAGWSGRQGAPGRQARQWWS